MRLLDARLLNAATLEALPPAYARARSSAVARRLAQGDWLIRRKRDGLFLAVKRGDQLQPIFRGALPRALNEDLAELFANALAPERPRPLDGLQTRLLALGLDAISYGERTGLAWVAEPTWFAFAGRDRYRRPLWLSEGAARAWHRLRSAAHIDGIMLEAISGYRSYEYQLGIFQRKRLRGQSLEQILAVNALPGFSEHHSGDALDIGTPGEPPAEESFEHTTAFSWLMRCAPAHGFALSYPRGNPNGIVYEPWHWRWESKG